MARNFRLRKLISVKLDSGFDAAEIGRELISRGTRDRPFGFCWTIGERLTCFPSTCSTSTIPIVVWERKTPSALKRISGLLATSFVGIESFCANFQNEIARDAGQCSAFDWWREDAVALNPEHVAGRAFGEVAICVYQKSFVGVRTHRLQRGRERE